MDKSKTKHNESSSDELHPEDKSGGKYHPRPEGPRPYRLQAAQMVEEDAARAAEGRSYEPQPSPETLRKLRSRTP